MAYIRVYLNNVLKEQVKLDKCRVTVGRSDQNDLVLENAGVSSVHAIIEPQGSQYLITDNNSTNGVFINQQKIDSQILQFWDEVQIYNYVLKFMQLPGLVGEVDPDLAVDSQTGQQHTMEVLVADVDELAKLRNQRKEAFLVLVQESSDKPPPESRYPLTKVNCFIGRDKSSNIRTGGWFAPKVAACIQRKPDGYHILPRKRGRTRLSGEELHASHKLKDKDKISVRGIDMIFYHRVVEGQ